MTERTASIGKINILQNALISESTQVTTKFIFPCKQADKM